MKHYRGILLIGIIEILIGSITLFANVITIALTSNTKSPNVLFFVIVTAVISTLIGVGILKFKKPAYQLLLYFSSVILLSKFLIFAEIIHLNGALETSLHPAFKNGVSVLYHGFIIYTLLKSDIKQIFHKS